MTQVTTQVQARAKANVLANFLAGISRKICLGQALDAIAVLNDAKNWNVFCSQNPEGSEQRNVAAPKVRTPRPEKLFPPVKASVYTDDLATRANFDIRTWLDQATVRDIVDLMDEEWTHCTESDNVAEFYEKSHSGVMGVFEHLYNMPSGIRGFECEIDGCAALAWLKTNAPSKFGEAIQAYAKDEQNRTVDELEFEFFPGTVARALGQAQDEAKVPPAPTFSTLKALDVNMLEVVGEYDTPDTVPEWSWVTENASFSHCGNNRDSGVYEYMVNVECINSRFPDKVGVPEKLRDIFAQAIATNSVWVLFYQA